MSVLVTGGAGWIGRAVCAELGRRGVDHVSFDRADGDDIRGAYAVSAAVRGRSHVIRLAGMLGTHELLDAVGAAVEVNVKGAQNVLEACARAHVPYTAITMPEVNPSVYAATKIAAHRLAVAYHAAYQLPISHVCAYNAFGVGQAYGAGHPQKIIPTFASRAWRGEPIPVWGDGTLLVDLIHVDQVARMLVDATGFGDGEMFDAGSGVPFTVLDVVNMVAETVGVEPKIEWLPWRKGERTEPTVDDYASGRGWELLGWRPSFDRDTLTETIRSYR